MIVDLSDGRSLSVPLAWYPRLLNASPAERKNWRVAGGGYGIHWPEIDEDISVPGLPGPARLTGAPRCRSLERSDRRLRVARQEPWM